jgi:hypothetical protein
MKSSQETSAEVRFPAGTIFAGELKIGGPMSLGDGKLQTTSETPFEGQTDHTRDCRVDELKVVLERCRDRIYQGANDTLPASIMYKSGKLSIEKFFRLRHGRLETHPVSERRQNRRVEPLVDNHSLTAVTVPGLGVTKVPT